MNKVLPLFVVLMLFALPGWPAESTPVTDKPSISASQSATVSAIIEAINYKTREVTLRKNDGSSVNIVVSKDARNLDQVQVGDIVVVKYIETLDIKVFAANDDQAAKAEVAGASAAARTKKGEMPGMAAMDTVVITAIVEEINIDANTFKLKGPEGNIQEYTARNPENLKKAAVGDLVVIIHSQAMALTVERAK